MLKFNKIKVFITERGIIFPKLLYFLNVCQSQMSEKMVFHTRKIIFKTIVHDFSKKTMINSEHTLTLK